MLCSEVKYILKKAILWEKRMHKTIMKLEILPFDSLLSEVHYGISIDFFTPNVVENEEQNVQKVQWNKYEQESLVNYIDTDSVLSLI